VFRFRTVSIVAATLIGLVAVAQEARREARDRDWPSEPGMASICLWADDALAACSITIDDNTAPDHAWWQEMSRKYGLRLTWFIITSRVGTAWGGTWDGWRQLHAAGHDVQSHTVNHLHIESPTWKGPEAEYADSIKEIEANMPGNKVLVLAYPGGKGSDTLNDPALAAKHYIGARGARGLPNPAHGINYRQTNSIGVLHVDDAAFPQANLPYVFEKPTRGASFYRGWYCSHYHGVKPDDRERQEKIFAYVRDKVASRELWLGLFREVIQYAQERDATTLSVTENTPSRIALSLTNPLDPQRYDYPLTVKVRLPDGWPAPQAVQNNRPIEARVIEHDGARYALVKAIPNRGAAVLSRP